MYGLMFMELNICCSQLNSSKYILKIWNIVYINNLYNYIGTITLMIDVSMICSYVVDRIIHPLLDKLSYLWCAMA